MRGVNGIVYFMNLLVCDTIYAVAMIFSNMIILTCISFFDSYSNFSNINFQTVLFIFVGLSLWEVNYILKNYILHFFIGNTEKES